MLTPSDLAARLGLRRSGRAWHGRCPACAYNAFNVRAGRLDRALLWCANGCAQHELRDAVRRLVGGHWTPPKQPDMWTEAEARRRKQEAALRLWRSSEPAPGTPVQAYGTARGLPDLARSAALRFRPDCPHPDGGRLPAMVALVMDATGAPIAVHRTYLRRNGSGKADIERPKMFLGPVWGGAIRLDPLAPELVIGEGIETSASAGRMLGLPAWSALSAGNLGNGLVLPSEVRSVMIAADPDESGQKAAREAWRRWTAEGRRVRIAMPNAAGDFNDVLRAQGVAHA